MVILPQYYKYEKVWEKAKRQRPWNLTEVLKLDGSLQKTMPKDIQTLRRPNIVRERNR
nr:MAG TPA: hypothetical protein [Caudoviricetes sp.]